MTRARSVGAAILAAAAVVALDQATKAIVRAQIPRGSEEDLFLSISLVNIRNRGVAFGLFAGGGTVVVVGAALALLAALVFFLLHASRPLAWLAAGLLVGGAAGNVIDRVREGAVTDFIDFPYWPAFNVADMAVTCGVVMLLWVIERPRAGDG